MERADGTLAVHERPAAEATGQISGVYFVECDDAEEAMRWAKKVPSAALGHGSVEVRPCVHYGGGS